VNRQADELLAKVKLTDAGNVITGSYSGGMRRRLSVAIALLGACGSCLAVRLAGFRR
jgi:ABC-type multidrug transport system ATPase subunit